MDNQWKDLEKKQKVRYILIAVISILTTLFAVFNWQSVKLHLIVTSFNIPLTVLIFISMLVGFAASSLFDYFKKRKKSKQDTSQQ